MVRRELPVSTGQEIELIINNLNHGGKGVGRYEGIAVFVPFTLPGERVQARVTEVKKNYALAELIKVVESSATRGDAPCGAFGECGGCQLQHQDYQEHLQLKSRLVKENLIRIGGLEDITVHDTLGMDEPWGYRNKVHFQVQDIDGKVRFGFYPEESHNLVAVESCLLVDPELVEVAARVEELVNKYAIAPYNWKTGEGSLRHLLLRKGKVTGEIMVVLVTTERQIENDVLLAKELMNTNEKIVSVLRNINTAQGRMVLGEDTRVLGGRLHMWERLGELTFAVSAGSFFQVNTKQAEVLYDKVRQYADLSGREQVIDVYCGVGTIALYLARRAKRMFGVEIVPEAVIDAKRNTELNKIRNAQFLAGKAEEILPKMKARGVQADVIVLDPPRKGCDERALAAVVEMAPEKIIYVSCDPSTLARDLKFLTAKGYRVEEVQPVDMFPWTAHVESVVLLQRKM